MQPQEFFAHWRGVRADLIRTIEAFNEEELDHVPFEGGWPVGDIMLHIADTEAGWIQYGVTQEIEAWPDFDRLHDYPNKQAIRGALEEVHARTEEFLSRLSAADLETTVTTPWGKEHSLLWILWHVIEHEIHHRGELSLILGYLGREGVID